ncbi:hypothetical protein [Limnobacter sp.]|uniref:hypothetical protein n=1 Tax=Limnobacter sp. TaxID=2003368 RepID=UPI0025C52114|nr:hypothetical protein [Limnobacter sp.]
MALGKLVVDLSLEYASYTKGLDKASYQAEQFEKNVKKRIDGAVNGVSNSLKGLALGAAAGVGAALSVDAAFSKLSNTFQELDRTAKSAAQLGILVEDLSRLEFAAGLSGVGADQLRDTLKDLSKNAVEASKGSKAQAEAFELIGVSVTDAEGKVKSLTDLLPEVADAFSGFEDGATKSELAMKIFGEQGLRLIPLLNQGAEGIRAMGLEADALGITMSAETAANAELFNDNLARLQGTITGLTQSIAQDLLPALNSILTPLLEGIKASGSFKDSISAVASLKLFGSEDLAGKRNDLAEIRKEIERLSAKSANGDLINGALDFFVELPANIGLDYLVDTQSDLNNLKAQEAILTKQIADATGETKEKDQASLEARRKEIETRKTALEAEKKAAEEAEKLNKKRMDDESKAAQELAKKTEESSKKRQEESRREADNELKRRLKEQEKLAEDLKKKLDDSLTLKIESRKLEQDFKKSADEFGKALGGSIQAAFTGGEGSAQGFAQSLQGYLLNSVIQPAIDLVNRTGGGDSVLNSALSSGLTAASQSLEGIGSTLQRSLGQNGLAQVLGSIGVDVSAASDPRAFAQAVLASGASGLNLSVSELQNSLSGGLNSVDPLKFIRELSSAIGVSVARELNPNGEFEYLIGDVRSEQSVRRGQYGGIGVPGELGSDAAAVGRFVESQVNQLISILGGSERITSQVALEAFAGPGGNQASARIATYLDGQLLTFLEEVGASFSDGDLGTIAGDLAEQTIIALARAYQSSSENLNNAIDSAGIQFQAGNINFEEAIRLIEQAREVDLAFGQLSGSFSGLVQIFSGTAKVDEFVASLGGVSSAASALANFQRTFSGEAQAFFDTNLFIRNRLFDSFGGLPDGILDSRDALFQFSQGLNLTERSSLELYKILLENTEVFDRYFTLLEKQRDGYLSLAQTLGSSAQVFEEVERRVQVEFEKLEAIFADGGGFLNFDFRSGDPEYLVDIYKQFLDSGITDTRILEQLQAIGPLYKQYLDLLDQNKVEIDQFLRLIGGNAQPLRDSGASLRSILQVVAEFAGVSVDLNNLPKSEEAFRDFFLANFSNLDLPANLLNPLAIAANEYFDQIQNQSDQVTSALEEAFGKETEMLEKRLEATRKLRDELQSAFDRESGLLSSTADGFKDLAKTIGDFRQSLYLTELGGQTLTQQTQAARSRLSDLSLRAAAGDQDALREIATASSDYLQALQSTAGSAAEYQRAVADVNKILIQAQSDTLDAEQITRSQLTALESLVSGQLDIANQNRMVEEILADINAQGEDTAGLQARLNELQQLQAELLGSIDQNTSGLASAIENFAAFFDTTQTNEIAARYLALLESSGATTIQAAPQTLDGSPTVSPAQAQQLTTPTASTQLSAAQVNDLLIELREMHDSMVSGHAAIAGHTNKTARILERFDDGDAFLTRVIT